MKIFRLKVTLTLVCAVWLCRSGGEAASKPNFVIFYADDVSAVKITFLT